jgi:hypothetical protein
MYASNSCEHPTKFSWSQLEAMVPVLYEDGENCIMWSFLVCNISPNINVRHITFVIFMGKLRTD